MRGGVVQTRGFARTFYYNDTSVSARSVNAPLDVPNTREVYNII